MTAFPNTGSQPTMRWLRVATDVPDLHDLVLLALCKRVLENKQAFRRAREAGDALRHGGDEIARCDGRQGRCVHTGDAISLVLDAIRSCFDRYPFADAIMERSG